MSEQILRRDVFPTLIYERQLTSSDALNDGLLDAIRNERDQDKEGLHRSNVAGLGGWHSGARLHLQSEFALIARRVRDLAEHISHDLHYAAPRSLDMSEMWAIINPPGAMNRSHIHPGALWSGVYYVQAPDGSGDITFSDPRPANLMKQPPYETRPEVCQPSVSLRPKAGLMLIFPGWLYHAVEPNVSQGDRVILSFNLALR